MKIGTAVVGFALVTLLVSCASHPLVLAPVGPGPVIQPSPTPGQGALQVYSETREYYSDQMPYFPHSDYEIYTATGKRLERVWNHQSHQDEFPAIVTLAPGHYRIKAWAEHYGLVEVPIVIEANELTTVVLQPGWAAASQVASSEFVQMPDSGYPIGWRATP